jgi:two-component system, NtrC family, sensor histidine kinase HydH
MLARFRRRADARLFAAVGLATTLLGAVATFGSLQHVGRTFPGFVVWNNLVVVALGRPDWTGVAAPVPYRDRVTAVDAVPVRTRADVERVVGSAPPGTPHDYDFAGRGGATRRTIAAMRLKFHDWAATMGVYVLNGAAFLAAALAAFYLKPESIQSRALLAFGAIWGLALLLAVDAFTAGWLEPLGLVLESLTPAAVLHLACTFPELRIRSTRPLALLYLAGLTVGLVQVWAFWRSYPILLAVNDAVYLALAAAGVVAMGSIAAAAFAARTTPLGRRRARVVLAGAIVAFGLPLLALLAFFLAGQPVSFSLLTLTGFVFPLAIGYAVIRHDLFEADRFVRQSLVYAALTALVALTYAASVLVADRVAAGLDLRRSPLFPIAFVMIVLATIAPLRDRVQRAVDDLFHRGRIDYKGTIARASEHMTTLLDRSAIVQHVLATMRDALHLEAPSVWEREPTGLVRRGGDPGRIPADDPGLAALVPIGRPLSLDEVEQSVRLRDERDALRRLFAVLDAALVVPMVREGRLTGCLAVRGKATGATLSADDLDVLRTLANETAVALANAAAVEQLAEARVRLAHAERLAAIGELSAAVAHGIRNPLAGIRLAAQLGLEAATAADPVRESFEDVLGAVDRLEAQVRGILDFARPFEPRLEPLDLPALAGSVLDAAAARLEASGVTVALDVPPSLPRVLADRAHLAQAMQELLSNAVDAMPQGGRVTIDARADDGNPPLVRLGVQDEGPGVPPEVRDRIFQLFMTTKSGGTGVGLAVVRKIMERHGGRVTLEPSAGRGARFVLELPAASL